MNQGVSCLLDFVVRASRWSLLILHLYSWLSVEWKLGSLSQVIYIIPVLNAFFYLVKHFVAKKSFCRKFWSKKVLLLSLIGNFSLCLCLLIVVGWAKLRLTSQLYRYYYLLLLLTARGYKSIIVLLRESELLCLRASLFVFSIYFFYRRNFCRRNDYVSFF